MVSVPAYSGPTYVNNQPGGPYLNDTNLNAALRQVEALTTAMGKIIAAPASVPLTSGNYYGSPAAAVTTRQLSQGNVYLSRIVPGRDATLNQIAVEVATAGSTGAVIRLGVYALDWKAGTMTLLADAGTIDGTVVGLGAATIGLNVTEGQQLLLASVGQGAPTTQPTVRGITGIDPYWGFSNGLTTSQGTVVGPQIIGGAAGALPASLTSASAIGGVPRVLVKAA